MGKCAGCVSAKWPNSDEGMVCGLQGPVAMLWSRVVELSIAVNERKLVADQLAEKLSICPQKVLSRAQMVPKLFSFTYAQVLLLGSRYPRVLQPMQCTSQRNGNHKSYRETEKGDKK